MATDPNLTALPDAGVRFGLRALLAATVVASAAAAVAGAVYRSTDRPARAALLAFWAATAMTATVLALLRWIRNYRLSLAAGPARFRLQRSDSAGIRFNLVSFMPFSVWGPAMTALVAALFWVAGVAGVASQPRGAPTSIAGAALGGFVLSGAFTSAALAICSRRRWRRIWLCDHGVVVDGHVRPWCSVLGCHWHSLQPDWLVIGLAASSYAVRVPAARRGDVAAFLRRRTALADEGGGPGAAITPCDRNTGSCPGSGSRSS